ncbi:MAG: peptide cleavage/export ABC transporter [Kiritimatiellaeota bacterium]|nr:peptide cleavage/export ABC transporter [Kiritimatiellota bacterium]
MQHADLLSFISDLPLFSIYDEERLAAFLEQMSLVSYSAGEVVFEQGDAGDTFYVVYSGRIRILMRRNGSDVNLGVLRKGDHFGESALITDHPRTATARAVEDSVLLVVSREDFTTFLLAEPAHRDYFDKLMRSAAIDRFLKSTSTLGKVGRNEVAELVRCFKPQTFGEGEAVFRQGSVADKFYLVESGKLKVVRWTDQEHEILNFLREGDFFGEKALVEDTTRYADVICLTPCKLFAMHKDDFDALIQKSPKLRRIIQDRIESYKTPPPIPYKEVIKQELAALKETKVTAGEDAEKAVREDRGAAQKTARRRRSRKPARRFPFIRQYDEMTCGTTCLMMISRFYGKNFASARLRELAHVDVSGASLANLATAAEQLGYTTRALKLKYDGLRSVPLPCIVHWQGYHYIVVHKVSDRYVWVADPAIGLRKYDREHFEKNWSGITLTLTPTASLEEQTDDRSSLRNFLRFVTPHRKTLIEVLIASVLLNIFGLATPIFTQNVVDKVLTHNNTSMLNMLFIGMLLVLFFRIMVMFVRQYLIVHISMQIDLKMLVAFYRHMLALPLGYFKARKVGDFVSRFGENQKIRAFMTHTALSLMLDVVLLVVYLGMMFYYNTKMAALTMVFIPFVAAVTLVFTPILRRLNIDAFQAHAEADSHLIESITGIDTIKALHAESPVRWKWEDKYIRSMNIDFKLTNAGMMFSAFGDLVGTLSATVLLWFGAHQVMAGALTVGELMAFMALMGSVMVPVNRVIGAWDDIQQTLVSVDRLNDVFSAKREFADADAGHSGVPLEDVPCTIEFKDVFFRYGGNDDPYILSKINLKLPAGKSLALVGRSGSGKSTLVKLLARFWDVTEGQILINGVNVRHIDLNCLRRMIGFVLQETFIFNGTVRENIAYGEPEMDFSRVLRAAKMANAHDFVTTLPFGYDTRVGESGVQLSGGQKQRIGIARALYAEPRVLVFDEATSSLDSESEQAIQKNMQGILADKTSIIIAHRLSTVRDADVIAVLDNGEVVEQGSHTELMESKGLYHFLVHQQLNL